MGRVASRRTASGQWSVATGSGDVGEDARFLIYSVTKTMIATLALRMVARRELALDEPIARWLPDAPNGSKITLRQLLRHSSGLPDYGHLPEYHQAVSRGDAPWSDEEYFRRAHASELRFAPDADFLYSNIGYLLVRRAVEKVRGEPLDAALRAEVFAPLGIAKAFVAVEKSDLAQITFGRAAEFAEQDVRLAYHPGWVAHGVVAATAAEMTAFLHALFAGDLLDRDSLAQMRAGRAVPLRFADPRRPFVAPGYGLGVMQELDPSRRPILGHTGGGPGSVAAAYFCDGVASCVLEQGDDGNGAENAAVAAL